MLPRVLKNFNLFVDGRGYAGRVEEVTLPKLTIKTEDYQLGGLDTPVQLDMGMDKLECELTLSEYDTHAIKLFGITDSSDIPTIARGSFVDPILNAITSVSGSGQIALTLRGGLGGETLAEVTPAVIGLTGNVIELDFGQWKAGEHAPLRIRLALRYYKLQIGAENLVEIDVENKLRKINGADQVSALKGITGIRDAF